MEDHRGYLFVGLTSLLWASTAAVSKILLFHLDNLQVLFFTTLFASISLFLILLIQGKLEVIKTYKLNDFLSFACLGFVGVFMFRFFLQAALLLMPAQEAFIVNYTWPIMVVIFAHFLLKEPMNLRKILAIILSFVGVSVVISKGNLSSLNFNISGVAFALSGAIAYGIFSVLAKKQNQEKLTSTMFYYLFSLIYTLIAILAFSRIPVLSWTQLAGLLWLGIFPSGLAYVFWLLALKYGDTAKMSNLILITPFMSLVYIYFLLGEKILISSIFGLTIIVVGFLIQSTREERVV